MKMRAYLMNFGDNMRVVNDTANAAIQIGIGNVVECDIHEVHFNMIRRAVSTETLMAVPQDIAIPPQLSEIMELLKMVNTEPYDALLQHFFRVLPPPSLQERQYRPTRDMIRVALRHAARDEVSRMMRATKVNIREQGDPVTRQPPASVPDAPTPPKPAPEPKPAKQARQKPATSPRQPRPSVSRPARSKIKRERA